MINKPAPHAKRRHRRDGYVLVLVAMMLFGLFAMAALVIDLGFARLAQRQMQSATDSAALEGLRGQGTLDYQQRQDAAELLIAFTFDDDLNPLNGDDGVAGGGGRFGAGPIVDFSDGVGNPDLKASQLMTIDPNNSVYKPDFQRRSDAVAENQFDLAIQRGGVVDGEYDLLAEGPSVPFLFARGSMIDRRRIANGIFTGSVSRAVADRALRVGLPVTDTGRTPIYPGAVELGYSLVDWNGMRSDPRQMDSAKTIVGEQIDDLGPGVLQDGFCCIFENVLGENRVIGFGVISGGVALPSAVAVSNAVGRQGSVWNEIDPSVRDAVLARNDSISGGLLVARLAPGT